MQIGPCLILFGYLHHKTQTIHEHPTEFNHKEDPIQGKSSPLLKVCFYDGNELRRARWNFSWQCWEPGEYIDADTTLPLTIVEFPPEGHVYPIFPTKINGYG